VGLPELSVSHRIVIVEFVASCVQERRIPDGADAAVPTLTGIIDNKMNNTIMKVIITLYDLNNQLTIIPINIKLLSNLVIYLTFRLSLRDI
jgi:hypothetical protein